MKEKTDMALGNTATANAEGQSPVAEPATCRTVTEYRVVSQRQGNAPTDKRYRSLKSVRDRVGRLMSDEPWRFYGSASQRRRAGSDYVCCGGRDCSCGGLTLREETDETRSDLPPVEWVKVQRRRISYTPWQESDVPEIDDVKGAGC